MGTIRIPKKTKPVPKPKRKPGTRAGLTKAGIAAAAAKLIESVGPGGFSGVGEGPGAPGVGLAGPGEPSPPGIATRPGARVKLTLEIEAEALVGLQ